MFEYSSDPEWNQTLNEAYIYERGWEDMFIVIKRYITYHFLVFVVHKQPSKHEKKKMNQKLNYTLHGYYVYVVLQSRLESK